MTTNNRWRVARTRMIAVLAMLPILAVATITALPSCTGNPAARVNVHLLGSSPDTDTVTVTFGSNGTTDARSPYTFTQNAGYFGIDFPDPGADSSVNIAVVTFSKMCTTGSGQTQLSISSGQTYEVNININTVTASCPLVIKQSPDGVVQSAEGGIDCGQKCTANYPIGTQVSLKAIPSIPGTRYQWGGACSGNADCTVTISGATTVGVDFTPRQCTQAGFCWEYPRPQGADLLGAWVDPVKPDVVYAVGAMGTILIGNGTSWTTVPNVTTEWLRSIWGTKSTDIWVGGGISSTKGVLLHYDGSVWTPASIPVVPQINGIWGTSPTDVWAVTGTGAAGNSGVILHFDGSSWTINATVATMNGLNAVWGSGSKDVWAVGSNDTIIHYSGAGWNSMGSGFAGDYNTVWGTGPADVFVSGYRTIKWNGSAWVGIESGTGPNRPVCLWGSGTNTVWGGAASGRIMRWDGANWTTPVGPTPDLTGTFKNGSFLSIAGAGQIAWAVGSAGQLSRLNNGVWQQISSPVTQSFSAIWMNNSTDGWAVGGTPNGFFYHTQDGLTWTPDKLKLGSPLYSVWGSGIDNVWAVGLGSIYRYNGIDWSSVSPPSGTSISATKFYGVYGTGPNDVWIIGGAAGSAPPMALHWDGAALSMMPTPPDAVAVTVYKGSAYIAGATDSIYQFTGIGWNKVSAQPTYQFATAGNTLFASGSDGIRRYDGSTWTTDVSGQQFFAIYASSPTSAWAIGALLPDYASTRLFHWNGTAWTSFEQFPQFIQGIGGFGSSDVWVVGSGGSILHLKQ